MHSVVASNDPNEPETLSSMDDEVLALVSDLQQGYNMHDDKIARLGISSRR